MSRQLTEFFQNLESENWSGEVQITASEGHATVVLAKGQFWYAHRPIDRAVERLRRLEWAKIPPDEIVGSIKSWEDFVQHLVRFNHESRERLLKHLKSDRLELFFRTFFWTNIELLPREFEVDVADQPELHFYNLKSLEKILKEAQTRRREWPEIQSRIGSSRRIFVLTAGLSDTGKVPKPELADPIEAALNEFEVDNKNTQSGAFSEEELQILHLCDGKHRLQDIIRRSSDGEFLTIRRVVELWNRGLIAPKDVEPSLILKRNNVETPSARQWLWRALSGALLLALLFLSSHSISSSDSRSLHRVQMSLEVYRAIQGRYPLTLLELSQGGILQGIDGTEYSYHLVNIQEYSLETR